MNITSEGSKKKLPFVFAILLAFATLGCAAPKRFLYKPFEQGAKNDGPQYENVVIQILPLKDARTDTSTTEHQSLLCFIPLVPYVSYHNYDMTTYSANTGALDFNPKTDLMKGIVEHFAYTGLAEISTDSQTPHSSRTYMLETTITELRIDGFRTMYCLGLIPGCFVAMLGAPFDYATSRLGFAFKLKNQAGTVLLDKTYTSEKDYCVGEYYNWNIFKQVGFNLATIMNEANKDIARAIATDYPDARTTSRVYIPQRKRESAIKPDPIRWDYNNN